MDLSISSIHPYTNFYKLIPTSFSSPFSVLGKMLWAFCCCQGVWRSPFQAKQAFTRPTSVDGSIQGSYSVLSRDVCRPSQRSMKHRWFRVHEDCAKLRRLESSEVSGSFFNIVYQAIVIKKPNERIESSRSFIQFVCSLLIQRVTSLTVWLHSFVCSRFVELLLHHLPGDDSLVISCRDRLVSLSLAMSGLA